MPPIQASAEQGPLERSFAAEASADAVKEAVRRRAWCYDRSWRILLTMLAGGALVFAGLSLLFFLLGPPFLKLLIAGIDGYVLVLLVWQMWAK